MFPLLVRLLLVVVTASPLLADLNDFRDDVKKQEKDQPPPRNEPPATPGSDADCGGVICNLGFEVCSGIDWLALGSGWAQGNAAVRYAEYPWSDGTFVQSPGMAPRESSLSQTFEPGPGHVGWYNLQTGYLALKGMGSGATASFRGQFNGLIGPDADVTWITDGSQSFVASRVGFRLSMFQFDALSAAFYGQVDVWSGVLKRLGGAFGIEWRSLPFRPVEITVRTGMQAFPRFVLIDTDARVGVSVGRIEIQGGWVWWSLLDSASDIAATYQGPYLGVGFHW